MVAVGQDPDGGWHGDLGDSIKEWEHPRRLKSLRTIPDRFSSGDYLKTIFNFLPHLEKLLKKLYFFQSKALCWLKQYLKLFVQN